VIPHVHSIFTLGARPPTEMLFISVVRYFFVSRFPSYSGPRPCLAEPVQQLLAQYVYQIIARMNKLKEGATN